MPAGGPEREVSSAALAAYQAVNNRRISYDSLLWQMPALSLTAQAFLFSVALAPGHSLSAQAIASALALFVSIAAIHALRRFRLGQHMDQLLLDRVEGQLGTKEYFGVNPHASAADRAQHLGIPYRWPMSFPPTVLWMRVLGLFGAAALLLLVLAGIDSAFDCDLSP